MIILTGKDLVAHWNEGSSSYLLVTFDQLNSEHFAFERFFLQPHVLAADISCLGIMPREQNFYLSPEMEQVAALVAARRAGRKVLLFGQSVGGYASLKFSALLGADAVVACSPIYSLRAKDLEFTEERHQRVLSHALGQYAVQDRPEFDTMAIRPEETSGRLVVIYDPAEAIDAFSAETVAKRMPRTELVTVPHAGHGIYGSRWTTEMVTGLFEAVLTRGPLDVVRAVTRMRRNQVPFLVSTLAKAANRKPILFVAAMNAKRITSHPHYRELIGAPFSLRALALLGERGHHGLAASHLGTVIKNYYGLDIRPARWEPGATPLEMLERHRCLLLSLHGSFLCWNAESQTARFEPHPFQLQTRLPIVARIEDGRAVFRTVAHGVETAVRVFESAPGPGNPAPETFEAVDGARVAIRGQDGYLGALWHGGPETVPAIGNQERLVVLPLASNSALFTQGKANWFDQVAAGQEVSNQAVREASETVRVVQRGAPRWRGLFNRR